MGSQNPTIEIKGGTRQSVHCKAPAKLRVRQVHTR